MDKAWSAASLGTVQLGADGYFAGVFKTTFNSTTNVTTPLVDKCAAKCFSLTYKRFGIFDGDKCICANAMPTTHKDLLPNGHPRGCNPCSAYKDFLLSSLDIHRHSCGSPNHTSVYRADYRNHEWESP